MTDFKANAAWSSNAGVREPFAARQKQISTAAEPKKESPGKNRERERGRAREEIGSEAVSAAAHASFCAEDGEN